MGDDAAMLALVTRIADGLEHLASKVDELADEIRGIGIDRLKDVQEAEAAAHRTATIIERLEARLTRHENKHDHRSEDYDPRVASLVATITRYRTATASLVLVLAAGMFAPVRAVMIGLIPAAVKKAVGL